VAEQGGDGDEVLGRIEQLLAEGVAQRMRGHILQPRRRREESGRAPWGRQSLPTWQTLRAVSRQPIYERTRVPHF
jgi:hypothetical protein